MRANTKKLLSALVVLAMVLSMVPVVGLPAIEAKADAQLPTTCPGCNAQNVTWTPMNAPLGTAVTNGGHYYVSDTYSDDGGDATYLMKSDANGWTGGTVCLHLNGKTIETSRRFYVGNTTTMNIMASGGGITYTGRDMLFEKYSNTLTISGGTWTGNKLVTSGSTYRVHLKDGAIFNGLVTLTKGYLYLYDTASVDSVSVANIANTALYLEAGSDWTGTVDSATFAVLDSAATVPASTTGGIRMLDDAFEGTITLAGGQYQLEYDAANSCFNKVAVQSGGETPDPETPTLPTTCPGCNATNVTWTAMNAPLGTAVTNGGHYYVSDSYNDDGGDATYLMSLGNSNFNSGTVCLHLNGKTIETSRRFNLGGMSTMYIMANGGGITYTGRDMLFEKYSNTLTISGGTWTGNKLLTSGSTYRAHLKDGAIFNGLVTLTKGYLYLWDTAKVTGLTVADEANTALRMEAGWTGSVTGASFAGMADGAIVNTTSRGAYVVDGANWAGSITLAEGGSLKWDATKSCLVIDPDTVKVAKIGDTWYPSAQAAVNAAGANDVVVLAANATIDTTGKTVTVDAAGYNVTVNGTGTLYAIDSANDTYDATKCGTWTISNVTKWEAQANGGKYVLIAEATAGTYTAHRLDIRISAVNLRTTQAGLYYTAEYKCDDALKAKVNTYGVALSLSEIPTDLAGSAYTAIEAATKPLTAAGTNTYTTNSGAVVNILTEGGEQNAANAIKAVKANAYLEINTGAAEPVVVMGIADSDDSAEYSLADVLDTVNTGWNETWMTEGAKTLVAQFYKKWSAVFEAVTGYNFAAIAEKASSL